MNIDDYRALVAQEKEQAQKDSEVKEQPNAQTEPSTNVDVQATSQETTKAPSDDEQKTSTTQDNETTQQTEKEVATPQTIEIDGKEVPVDELRNGYLRQSDYTKKTQELANQRKEIEEAVSFYEQIKQNPQLAQQLSQQTGVQSLDPATAKIQELENKMYDMMVEREIETLQSKYDDFEVREVLQVAQEKNLNDLEDAYRIVKASKQQDTPSTQPSTDELKKQIREELLREIESERGATQSIISSNDSGAPSATNEPKVSEKEVLIAKKMGLSPGEYAKWRDAK